MREVIADTQEDIAEPSKRGNIANKEEAQPMSDRPAYKQATKKAKKSTKQAETGSNVEPTAAKSGSQKRKGALLFFSDL